MTASLKLILFGLILCRYRFRASSLLCGSTALAADADALVCHCQIHFESSMQSTWAHFTLLFSPHRATQKVISVQEKGFESSSCTFWALYLVKTCQWARLWSKPNLGSMFNILNSAWSSLCCDSLSLSFLSLDEKVSFRKVILRRPTLSTRNVFQDLQSGCWKPWMHELYVYHIFAYTYIPVVKFKFIN